MKPFLFFSGRWVGEGSVELSDLQEKIPFQMEWNITSFEEHTLAIQEIRFLGHSESIVNHFSFSALQEDTFDVLLDNDLVSQAQGIGAVRVMPSKKGVWFGWEFHDLEAGLDGYEWYEMDGSTIVMGADYSTSDGLRSTLWGKIWKGKRTKLAK